MKSMRKIASLLLALIMVMSLATVAFAAEGEEEGGNDAGAGYTITITAPANGSLENHTYAVYQIFTGDLATNEAGKKVLSNVKYGKNYGTKDAEVPESVLTDLAAMTGEAAAKDLNGKKSGEPYATLNADNNWKIENVPAGYYLIVDTSTDLPEGETSSAFILQLVEDVNVASKHSSVPNVEKKVDDKNDSAGEQDTIVWEDSADHDISDMVPFQLKMTVPASIAQFVEYDEAYKFTFHDKESTGLTFQPASVVVKLNGTAIADTHYDVVYPATDGDTFDIVFADMTEIPGIKANDVITVEYESLLNEGAILGSTGNPNEVYGEYSNLHRPDYPGRTPEDKVIVFTYEVNVDKYKEAIHDDNKLIGADFALYKQVSSTTTGARLGSDIKAEFAENVKDGALADDKYYIVAGVKSGNASGFTFGFKGVDDGNYVLVETTVPAGYNAWDAVAFTITATHEHPSDDPQLLTLTGGDLFTGNVGSVDLGNGILDTNIVNKSGTELPSTGGMGTTMFYVIGGILVAAAVVLLVTKKRMASAN